MGAWAVRFVLFGFGYQDDTAIMPMLLLGIIIHGICYDFLIVSGQIYVDRKFDPESRARAQAFLTLITQGIGIVIGTNIAGYVYGQIGRAHVRTTSTNAPLVCRLMLETKNNKTKH